MKWISVVGLTILSAFGGCLKPLTWNGDVYYCDRGLLEKVAAAKEAFANSPEGKSDLEGVQTK